MSNTLPAHQSIRTYKPRRGRVTPRQEAALAVGDDLLLAPSGAPLDLDREFDGRPVVVEIGFGTGAATVEMAARDPGTGILAIDVHTPGIGDLLYRARQAGLRNVRVIESDALVILHRRIPDQSIAGVRTFFPDPWPKARHHKRRLVQEQHAGLIAGKVRPGGFWHLATDWGEYAVQMIEVLGAGDAWVGGVVDRPAWRPVTRYEQAAIDQGRTIADLWFERTAVSASSTSP
jgi:tRNA (guanine-N7-)-methyltransferase